MKKYWSLIVYILIGAAAFIWLVKVPMLSYYLSQKIRVPVSIEWISIWPKETTITHFKIENPGEFSSRLAFDANKTKISYLFKNLFSNPLIIDELRLDTIYLGVEFLNPGERENNWTVIASQMPKQTSERSFIINKVVFTNFTVELLNVDAMGKTITRQVDRLELDEISSQQGFPTEQLIQKVFGGLHLDDLIKDVFNPLDVIDGL